MGVLVPGATAFVVKSVAVMVHVPEEPNRVSPIMVTVPFASAVFDGRNAEPSVLVNDKVSPHEVAMCQVASQALTVRLKGAPAVCGSGVPILPVAVPGALVSPGNNTCS